MKLKKVLALTCAAVMSASVLAGCGGSTEAPAAAADTNTAETADAVQESAEGEVTEIVFATPLTKTVDMAPIEEAMNEMLVPKIGVKVHIEGITMSNYTNQIGLMMSGGEQLDVMGFIGTYSDWLSKNQLMCLDDYIDTYGAGAKEALGADFLKSTTSEGKLYALPTLNGKAATMNFIIRTDLVEELDLPVDQLTMAETFDEYCTNLDLITDMYAKIHEAHPEFACVVPASTNPNTLHFDTQVPFVDNLNDNYGVLAADDNYTNVVNMYEMDEFKKLCEYAYKWNQAGYVLQDATTTQESALTYMQNGRCAGWYITGEEGQAEQYTTATGVDVSAYKFLKKFMTTTDVNGLGFAISATSKNPEAAMKFLNEMYTNADLINLLDWGIEGRDYEVQEDGTVDFPEGLSAETTQYGLNMDWFFGNQFLGYIWGKGRDTTIYERLAENNRTAQMTPVMGFSYVSTQVATELAALSNVTSQYLPGLLCGSLDPETNIDKFNEALKDAGIDTVIAEKQKQLDAWRAANQ